MTYITPSQSFLKPIVWLHSEVKSPPFSRKARFETGYYLRQLQRGFLLSMPHSRPMKFIGLHCHELRINDVDKTWRVMYRIDPEAVIVFEVFCKKTEQTPYEVLNACIKRLSNYDHEK